MYSSGIEILDEKKIFFTVLYRNHMHEAGSPEFLKFIDNFRDLYSNISSEKPYFLIFTGDFNAHSVQWWPNGDAIMKDSVKLIVFRT